MSEGKTVKIITVGRKGRDYLRREMAGNIVGDISFAGKKRIEFADVQAIGIQAVEMLGRDEFDVATVVYNRFVSVISQVPAELQIIPPLMTETGPAEERPRRRSTSSSRTRRPSSPGCCRRTSPSSFIARSWRAARASRARG